MLHQGLLTVISACSQLCYHIISSCMQAEELQTVHKELLAVRDSLKLLQSRRQEELMKDELDETELDQVKSLIAHDSRQELRLLRDLERLETRLQVIAAS